MTGSRVAALVMIPLAIVVGAVAGHFWQVSHSSKVATLVERPAAPPPGAAPAPATPAPATSSPATPGPAAPAPAAPAPQVAARSPAPAIGTLPQVAAPKTPAPDGKSPSFDVVRVEPQGDAVVAGKGAPNAEVALLSGGKVVGEAKSDANGQFVILPQRLAPGDHALTLRQTPDGAPTSESKQSVAISVPQPGKDRSKVVVALAEPGKATKLLSPPPGTAAGASPATPVAKVVIRSAELENGSGLYVSGAAPTGTSVHVYLNDSHIADVVAGADGAWSLRVKHGLTGGHYSVRADAAAPDGKVTSRAEVPFDVPMAMADAAKSPAAPPVPRGAAAPSAPPAAAAAPPPSPSAQPTTAAPPPAATTADATATAATTATAPKAAEAEPSKSADAEPGNASEAPAEKAPESNATIETVATAHVTKGDNLWNISRFRLGEGIRYTQIYAANSDQIRDPNLIYPGQVLVVPQH